MFEIEVPAPFRNEVDAAFQYAYNPVHCRELVDHMKAEHLKTNSNSTDVRVRAFRGLGGLAPELLRERCVNPTTRMAHALGAADVQGVIEVFGGAD